MLSGFRISAEVPLPTVTHQRPTTSAGLSTLEGDGMSKSNIWIDTQTGTWGHLVDIAVCSVTEDDLDFLDHASDSEIQSFGERKGGQVMEWN